MNLFSDFCNICYKTNDESLTDISGENIRNLKDTFITFVGHADIVTHHNIINLCQLCCEELIRCNKFREMCFTNLIQLRQSVFDMKSKLQSEDGGVCAVVENALQIFVHDEVRRRKTLEKYNSPVSISTEYENVNSSTNFNKNGLIYNCSDVSVINSITECNESQEGSAFLKCERETNEDFEFIKVECDLQNEIEMRASEDFALRNIESKSDEHVEIVNAGINSMKDELHVKQEKNISEDLELETIEDEFGVDLNVAFEVTNVCTTAKTLECGAKKITIEENAKDYTNKSTAVRMNAQPRPHVQEHSNGRCTTTLQSGALKRIKWGAEPHTCIVCNKSFRSSTCLTVHKATHCGDTPYKCTVCNKTFINSFNLNRHERIHNGDKPYKCSVCNKAFTQSSHLIRHGRIHTGDRPYKCTVCKKAFAESSTLTKHKRIHSGERPHKCSVCNMTFTYSSNLSQHKRIHSADRKYKCTV